MREKRGRDHRSRMLPGPNPYAGKDSTEIQRFISHGISERENQSDDIRQARESEVQVRKQEFLAPRVLCRHSRKKCEEDPRVHPAPTGRRQNQRSDFAERSTPTRSRVRQQTNASKPAALAATRESGAGVGLFSALASAGRYQPLIGAVQATG